MVATSRIAIAAQIDSLYLPGGADVHPCQMHGSLGAQESVNGISIGSGEFARLTVFTDREKNHATSRRLQQMSTNSTFSPGSVAEWLACWTQAHYSLGSNRSRDAVG